MALYEIPMIDAPWQRLSTVLADSAVVLELFWNTFAKRWSLSVEREGVYLIQGRRLVPGTDLLAGYDLGLGRLFLVDWEGKGADPGRAELPSGQYRLISDDGLT